MIESSCNLEAERLSALRALQLLDTPQTATFDRITKVASVLFDAEIALISLLDEERQWFLSRQGLEAQETPRAYSFCSVAIAQKSQLHVPDARTDERFSSNPLVTGAPFIRSYLGQPIRSPDGSMIGALCVIDSRPQKFVHRRPHKLTVLAEVVEDLLRAHKQALDMTEMAERLRGKNDALGRANRIFVAAEKAARIGSWEVELETMALSWSDGVYAIHNLPVGTPIDVNIAIDAYAEGDRSLARSMVENAISMRQPFAFEANLETKDGETRRVQARGEYVAGDDKNPDRLVGVIHDITESHHAKTALQRAADFDNLTDLYNRNAFDRILGEKIKLQSATGKDLAVLMLDLDGFKSINDTFGHLVGDMVLEEISGRLKGAVSEGVVIARWGGDEFVFIPPLGSTRADIEALYNRLAEAVERPFFISGRKLAMHATGGVEISDKVIGGREFVRRADLAMYSAKKRDTGTLRFYDESLEQNHKEKMQAIIEVREAIEGGRFYASYQPIVDLLTGEPVGLEALMRLRARNGNELTASNVMPAIIDPHISRQIGDEMVASICADHAQIALAMGRLDYISLNATEADLLSHNYAPNLLRKLRAAGVDPAALTLEVTETMLMVNDNDTARKVLTDLKAAGMQIALDDFGTGFSSLTHLRDFPIDIVKIDRSFIHAICSDHQSRLIVQAIIAMAQSLGIKVIAEGIETECQRDLLAHMGCKFGQGYLLGYPQTRSRLQMQAIRKAGHDAPPASAVRGRLRGVA
jgi:diguanylate cyclase (GGDEF)-like protein/PAS domain S-box-containing protein